MTNHSHIFQNDRKLLKSTRFASIYSINGYAIKVISTDFVTEPHNPKFELSILKKLSNQPSSHVIQLIDSRTVDDELELLFEFYPMDLHEFVRRSYKSTVPAFNPYYNLSTETGVASKLGFRNKFDVNKYAFDFMQQLAKGLQFLHSQGIIHRDIKSQNVMVSSKNDSMALIITDFGISYDTQDSAQLKLEPQDNKITDVSTSVYKAPELLFGVKKYTFAVDIWALMVLISEWFQERTENPSKHIPAMFDDGTGSLRDSESGSDIKLILSIFEHLGIPSIEEWPEVKLNGSCDAFCGMFGSEGDGKYIINQAPKITLERVAVLFPRLQEITNSCRKQAMTNCILGMMPFESAQRWDSNKIIKELTL